MGTHSQPENNEDQPTCSCGSTTHTDMWHDEYWPEGDDL